MSDDPDEMLAMLADLTGATDPALRELARRLAGRLFLDVAKRGPSRPRGIGKLVTQRYRPDGGDLDVDASLDAIVDGAFVGFGGRPGRPAESAPGRRRARRSVCSSIAAARWAGKPLATNAVAASAVAWRAPDDYSVLSFGKDVVAAKSQDIAKSNEMVVDSVLALRGFGTTDVAGALMAARDQLIALERRPQDRRAVVRLPRHRRRRRDRCSARTRRTRHRGAGSRRCRSARTGGRRRRQDHDRVRALRRRSCAHPRPRLTVRCRTDSGRGRCRRRCRRHRPRGCFGRQLCRRSRAPSRASSWWSTTCWS